MKMKTSWFPLFPIWLLSPIAMAATPLQFCTLNEGRKTDLCFAVASWKNATTKQNDVSLHISAKFVVDATGWAAVGIGEGMDNALMFVMYPGAEAGRVTLSVRTTRYHNKPKVAADAPEVHVTGSWKDDHGMHNVQLICYNCDSWYHEGSNLNILSDAQPWIWATNWKQQTHSDDIHMRLLPHNDKGQAELNMAAGYAEAGPIIALVSTQRISQDPTDEAGPVPGGPVTTQDEESEDHHPKKEQHKHSLFGLVSIHGFLLASGFFVLTFGVLGIRSGLSNAYKVHWVIQTAAGLAIVIGCLMGVYLSYKHGGHFNTVHQWIGLSMLPSVVIQGALGYLHHVNYLKYGRRTAVSHIHLWAGRAALLIGNVNVGFGLNLGHADSFKWFIWYAGLSIQLSVLVPMWAFWMRGKTILDAVRRTTAPADRAVYESVEQEAFIVNDELDEFDDEVNDDDDDAGKSKGKGY